MTAALPITSRQMEALCKGAAKAGMIVEVKIGAAWEHTCPDCKGTGCQQRRLF